MFQSGPYREFDAAGALTEMRGFLIDVTASVLAERTSLRVSNMGFS